MTDTEEFKETITNTYKSKESIYNGVHTKTSLFLLPMLGLTLKNSFIRKHLLNAYLDDLEFTHDFKRPIFILLKTKSFKDPSFEELVNIFRQKKEIKIDYDLGVQLIDDIKYNLVMFVFECPEKWIKDYYCFKSGHYSKMSDEYKNLFPRETIDKDKKPVESLMWGVMHKSDFRKNQVALHFTVKDNLGKPKNLVEYNRLRKEIETYPEIWDGLNPKEEIYNFKE